MLFANLDNSFCIVLQWVVHLLIKIVDVLLALSWLISISNRWPVVQSIFNVIIFRVLLFIHVTVIIGVLTILWALWCLLICQKPQVLGGQRLLRDENMSILFIKVFPKLLFSLLFSLFKLILHHHQILLHLLQSW